MRSRVRHLAAADLAAALAMVGDDPVANCFIESRIRMAGADPWRLGGELLGWFAGGTLESMLFVGANLVPVRTTAASRAAFADRLRLAGRRCSSFIGPAEEVLDLWRLLEPAWGPARDVRHAQPLLALHGSPQVESDPRVRRVDIAELDILMPACIDMFTEEVGVSPVAGGSGAAYRARVADLIRQGRAFAWIEDGQVQFKAEVGCATAQACQVQGVWAAHALRGRGIAAAAMSAVVRQAQDSIAPVVSLYVNDFNTPARKTYARVGFEQVGTFATVLF
ncbi:MAG: GNAT family N-acetyltransferase [Actinomycetales bacterium]|nr:GNAT family N-acetyltransferase [Actinomycetales bacterium]